MLIFTWLFFSLANKIIL